MAREKDQAKEQLYRANWVLQGHKGKTVQPGETIRLTQEEAEPYVKDGTLSLVKEKEEASQADASEKPTGA
jgi:hypothetical protein